MSRLVELRQNVLKHNDEVADRLRRRFEAARTLVISLVSSPGSGKTTLLTATIERLRDRWPVLVVEGDQQTSRDADRIRAACARAVQINTGKGCHLDAHAVGHAVDELDPPPGALLLIENVGNLVCPAAFDLGEARKVLILSVTEGEDKPLKYPDMFAAAGLLLLNKVDLLPHLDFDVDRCLAFARQVNPGLDCILTSARSGEGLDQWIGWLETERRAAVPATGS